MTQTPQSMTPASEWERDMEHPNADYSRIIERIQAEARRCGFAEARAQAVEIAMRIKSSVSPTINIALDTYAERIAALQLEAGEGTT